MISSSVFPTPEKTILAGSPPAIRTLVSSPPETISKPDPSLARSESIERFEFALTE